MLSAIHFTSLQAKVHNLGMLRERLRLKRRFETGADDLLQLQGFLHGNRDGGRGGARDASGKSPELWELALANRPSTRSVRQPATLLFCFCFFDLLCHVTVL